MAKEKILNYEDLEAKLEGLTGDDLEECEKEEVIAGNKSANVAGSRTFLIRLAAKALGVSLLDLKKLPLRQYLNLVRRTDLFFADILDLQIPSPNTANLQ